MNIADTTANDEDIEGLDKDEYPSLEDYQLDTLLIRAESRTVHDVLRRIKAGGYVMNPDFQRDFIWPEDKQSKLIESVLMRIPLPVFYLGEDDKGRMIVVDGLQRLSTFERFVNHKFKLDLPYQSELHKKYFEDLSPKLQNRIEDCNLILYVIDSKMPEWVRLDIFERVNSGVPLTRQQMRNCLYNGQATQFLKAQAETPLFKQATGGSLNPKTMRDREFVNRFCAFRLLPLDSYKDSMDEWLARALETMNSLDASVLATLGEEFQTALSNNLELFGGHAFRKHTCAQARRSALNASLWDVMATGFASYSLEQVKRHRSEFTDGFYQLLRDQDFNNLITSDTNSPRRVNQRFIASQKLFKEVFNA